MHGLEPVAVGLGADPLIFLPVILGAIQQFVRTDIIEQLTALLLRCVCLHQWNFFTNSH